MVKFKVNEKSTMDKQQWPTRARLQTLGLDRSVPTAKIMGVSCKFHLKAQSEDLLFCIQNCRSTLRPRPLERLRVTGMQCWPPKPLSPSESIYAIEKLADTGLAFLHPLRSVASCAV